MVEEGLYCPCSENKGVDQLRGLLVFNAVAHFRVVKCMFFSWQCLIDSLDSKKIMAAAWKVHSVESGSNDKL